MAAAAAAVMVIGTVVNFVGQYNTARAQKDAANKQADLIEKQAATQEEQFRRKGKALQSRQQAYLGASGVMVEGTPMLVMQDTAEQLEKDALYIREQGQDAADLARKQGDTAYWSGMLNSFGTLLTSGAQIYQALGPKPQQYGGTTPPAGSSSYPSINLGGGYAGT